MSFRLVAFDVDGTLVGRDLAISDAVRDAVRLMQAAGVTGCLVTGRMYRATLPFARELNFDAPVVCYQGAAIVDPSSDEILQSVPLKSTIVRELIAVAEGEGMHLQLYRNDEYYCEAHNRFSELYAALALSEPIVVPSLRETFAYSPATKAVVVADGAAAQGIAEELAQRFTGRAYVTRSLPQFVEVLDPSVDKGVALRFVAARLGIPMENTLAIGDSWNDAPLLRAAGFSVAMGSAPPELRAVASATVGDLEHDGVAEALKTFVLA